MSFLQREDNNNIRLFPAKCFFSEFLNGKTATLFTMPFGSQGSKLSLKKRSILCHGHQPNLAKLSFAVLAGDTYLFGREDLSAEKARGRDRGDGKIPQ